MWLLPLLPPLPHLPLLPLLSPSTSSSPLQYELVLNDTRGVPAAKVTVEANFSKPIGEVKTEKPKAPEISADMTAVGALEAELAALKRHTERLQQENVTIQRTLATKEAQVCALPHLPQLPQIAHHRFLPRCSTSVRSRPPASARSSKAPTSRPRWRPT